MYVCMYAYALVAATTVKIAHAIKAITSNACLSLCVSGRPKCLLHMRLHSKRRLPAGSRFGNSKQKKDEKEEEAYCYHKMLYFRVIFLANLHPRITHSITSYKKDKCGLVYLCTNVCMHLCMYVCKGNVT